MTDDETQKPGRLLHFPPNDDVRNRPPLLPDTSALFPTPDNDDADTGDNDSSPTIVLPVIPGPVDPISVLNSSGIDTGNSPDAADAGITPAGDAADEVGDGEYGDYTPPRSLSDRIGDWIEFRIGRARDRHTVEQPAREAEIARKVELLKARTAHEAGVIQQNGKLQQAQLKARGDLAAANGKSRADSSKNPGRGNTGSGKPGGGKPNSGTTNPSNGNRPGNKTPDKRPTNGPGGAKNDQRRSKPPEKPAGLDKKIPPKTPNGAGGGVKPNKDRPKTPDNGGRKNGPGAGGSGKGPGSDRKKLDPSNGGGGPKKPGSGNGPGSGPKKIDLKKNRGDKPAPDSRGTSPRHNQKVLDKAKRDSNGQTPRKINLTKDKKTNPEPPSRGGKGTGKKGPGGAPDGPSRAPGTPRSEGASKGSSGPSGASNGSARKGPTVGGGRSQSSAGGDTPRRPWEGRQKPPKQTRGTSRDHAGQSGSQENSSPWWRRTGNTQTGQTEPPAGPVTAESVGITVERPDQPTDTRHGRTQHHQPAGLTTGPLGLPAAPEPHTPRPGTSRTSTQPNQPTGEPVSSTTRREEGEITFGEYLTSMANIAVETRQDTAGLIGLVAYLKRAVDEFQTMADVLANEHNIDRGLTNQIADLADQTEAIKKRFGPDAQRCQDAFDSVVAAATAVAQAYRPDMDAKEEAGLAQASGADHHN